jgi:hypothetical protein
MVALVSDNPEPIAVSSAQRITSEHHLILFVKVRKMNPNNKEYLAKPIPIQALQPIPVLFRLMRLQERVEHRVGRWIRFVKSLVPIVRIKLGWFQFD